MTGRECRAASLCASAGHSGGLAALGRLPHSVRGMARLALAPAFDNPPVPLTLERVPHRHAGVTRCAFWPEGHVRIGLILAEGNRCNIHLHRGQVQIGALRQVIDDTLPHRGLVLNRAIATSRKEHGREHERKIAPIHTPIISTAGGERFASATGYSKVVVCADEEAVESGSSTPQRRRRRGGACMMDKWKR